MYFSGPLYLPFFFFASRKEKKQKKRGNLNMLPYTHFYPRPHLGYATRTQLQPLNLELENCKLLRKYDVLQRFAVSTFLLLLQKKKQKKRGNLNMLPYTHSSTRPHLGYATR
jgi:hypothetical protein